MSRPTVKLYFHKPTWTATYLVFDAATKDAVLIDTVMDLDIISWQTCVNFSKSIAKFIDDNNLKLHYILDTHTHADHVTGAAWFVDRYKVPYCIGANITAVQQTFAKLFDLPDFKCDGSQFGRLLHGGEQITAGSLTIACIDTRGHTPNCLSYHIGDAVFTGDALFIEDQGTGRCDFPGGSANDLYDSLRRLYGLPETTRVFVGHDYQPGGRELRVETSITAEREKNIQMKANTTRTDYVTARTERDKKLLLPRLIYPCLFINMNGGRLPEPRKSNGIRCITVPLNVGKPTSSAGEQLPSKL